MSYNVQCNRTTQQILIRVGNPTFYLFSIFGHAIFLLRVVDRNIAELLRLGISVLSTADTASIEIRRKKTRTHTSAHSLSPIFAFHSVDNKL